MNPQPGLIGIIGHEAFVTKLTRHWSNTTWPFS